MSKRRLKKRAERASPSDGGPEPGRKVPPPGKPASRSARAAATGLQSDALAGADVAVWNEVTRELFWREQLVLRPAEQAYCEGLILSEFQRRGWPPVIDNPLTGTHRARRRRDAVYNLKRHQVRRLIDFYSIRRGGRIGWTVAEREQS